jgi:hypothetical protein
MRRLISFGRKAYQLAPWKCSVTLDRRMSASNAKRPIGGTRMSQKATLGNHPDANSIDLRAE